MLKKEDYIYETNNYKIINPNKKIEEKIRTQMINYQKEDGQIDFDNEEFNFYLFKELIEFVNEEFNFKQYSISEFNNILNSPSQDIETIAFYIGNIISDIIISDLRRQQLEIKMANIELLQSTTINSLNSFKSDIRQAEQNSKRIADEKRINKIRHEKGFDTEMQVETLSKFKKFLYNHNLIK